MSLIRSIILFYFIASSTVFANDAPLGNVGKTIQPRDDVDVRMAAEDVRIVIDNETAKVTSAFYLMNEGDEDTILVGFTRGWEGDHDNFRAYASGYELDVETKTAEPFYASGESDYPWWKVFRVPLNPGNQVTEVVNEYSSRLMPYGHIGIEDKRFTYIMTTGALWKDTIEDARITIYLDDIVFDRITHISPDNYVRDNNRLTWHFSDFEPSQNIGIAFMQSDQFYTIETALKTLAAEPDNAHARFLLGTTFFLRSFQDSSLREKGRVELEKAVELDPDHLDARFFLATLCYCNQNKDRAKRQLEAIIARNPGYVCENSMFPDALMEAVPSRSAVEWLKSMEE